MLFTINFIMIPFIAKIQKNLFLFLFIIGGILLGLVEFIPWGIDFTPFSYFQISIDPTYPIPYLFPLFSSIIILGTIFLLLSHKKSARYVFILVFLFAIELDFLFISEMINVHGSYLWKYPGIYLLILGIIELFSAFFLQFSSPIKKTEDMELNS
jgi:hypothetical protein